MGQGSVGQRKGFSRAEDRVSRVLDGASREEDRGLRDIGWHQQGIRQGSAGHRMRYWMGPAG